MSYLSRMIKKREDLAAEYCKGKSPWAYDNFLAGYDAGFEKGHSEGLERALTVAEKAILSEIPEQSKP